MNRFNPDASISNMWKAYNNMPTKTTALDRIIEKEKGAQKQKIDEAIGQATSRTYIQSKKVSGEFFKRFDEDKAKQSAQTLESIHAFRRFIGKGMKIDLQI